jgi:hypothetical protein
MNECNSYKISLIFRVVLKQQTEGGMGIFILFVCFVWSLFQVSTPVSIVTIRMRFVVQATTD